MRHTTKDMKRTAGRGVFGTMTAFAIVAVVSVASGDSSVDANAVSIQRGGDQTQVAGVLLSPRTRLIIDYQRVALA